MLPPSWEGETVKPLLLDRNGLRLLSACLFRVSLCNNCYPGCSGTCFEDWVGLEQSSACFCLPSAGSKGVSHHTRRLLDFNREKATCNVSQQKLYFEFSLWSFAGLVVHGTMAFPCDRARWKVRIESVTHHMGKHLDTDNLKCALFREGTRTTKPKCRLMSLVNDRLPIPITLSSFTKQDV